MRYGAIGALIVLLLGGVADATPPVAASAAAHAFFAAVHDKRYQAAYDFFSDSLQDQFTYRQFVTGAQAVKRFGMVEQTVLDSEPNLVKFKVKAKVRLEYKGKLYDALYAGEADMYLERGQWKVLTVDLHAMSHKLLDSKALQYR